MELGEFLEALKRAVMVGMGKDWDGRERRRIERRCDMMELSLLFSTNRTLKQNH